MLVFDPQDGDEHAHGEQIGMCQEAPIEHGMPRVAEDTLGTGDDEGRRELADERDEGEQRRGGQPGGEASAPRRTPRRDPRREQTEQGEHEVERELDRQRER